VAALAGKYELGEPVGSGGMAEVFHGMVRGAEGFERQVAIKRIRASVSKEKNFAEMFVREAKLVSRLSHPNIVQTIDFDRDAEGRFFLVMELIRGVDLRKLIREGPVPIGVATYVATEVLQGLDHAHALEYDGRRICIVHRDVSPHNIMLSWQGAVKLVDFGIAKAIEGSMVSRSGSLKGKVSYMSPEQVHGKQVDGRSDLFAVGIVLYELLTNSRLFLGSTDAETLSLLLTKPFPSPRELNPEIPEDLESIVMRLVERDRNQRYASALDVIEDLSNSSAASARAKLDLESLLAARFPQAAPSRARSAPLLQTSPPMAVDAMGATLEAAPRPGEDPTAATHPLRGRTPSNPVPNRTLTAGPSAALPEPSPQVPQGWQPNIAASAPVPSSDAVPSRPARRRLLLLVGVSLAAFAAVVGLAVFSEDPSDKPAPRAAAEPEHADAAPPKPRAQPVVKENADAGSSDAAAPEADASPRSAKLSVKVAPWAEIELDGRKRGQTPQEFDLEPGRHKLVLRSGKLERTIRFRLKPGQSKTLSYDWINDPPH
jgi:serine/threonine protein kinase